MAYVSLTNSSSVNYKKMTCHVPFIEKTETRFYCYNCHNKPTKVCLDNCGTYFCVKCDLCFYFILTDKGEVSQQLKGHFPHCVSSRKL